MSSVPGQIADGQPRPSKAPKTKGSATEAVRTSLHDHLRKTATFIKLLDSLVQVFAWIAGLLGLWLVACLVDHWLLPLPKPVRWLFWLVGVGGTMWWIAFHLLPLLFKRINLTYAAKRIEHLVPEFKNGLISWLELENLPDHGVPRGVMAALAYRAKRFIGNQDPSATVDTSPLIKLIGGVLVLTTTLVVYTMISPKSVRVTAQRILMPWSSISAPSRVELVSVKPGAVELTQGKPLVLDVEVRGLRREEPVIVHFDTLDGQQVDRQITLAPVSEGFRYAGEVTTDGTGVEQALRYWVEAGDARSESFAVTLSPLPIVVLEAVELEFPAYTNLKPRRIEGGSEVEAVEGTRARIVARANLSMKSARLEVNPEIDDRQELIRADTIQEMEVDGRDVQYEWLLQLKDQQHPTEIDYRIRGYSLRGDANPLPLVHHLSVLADLAPEVELVGPEDRILKVTNASRVPIEIRASDPDFGLSELSVQVAKNGRVLGEKKLLETEGVIGKQVKSTQLDVSRLNVAVGDEIEIVAIAKDNRHAPSSQAWEPNIVRSDPLTLKVVDPAAQPDVPPAEPASQPQDANPLNEPANNEPQNENQPDTSSANSESAGGENSNATAGGESSGANADAPADPNSPAEPGNEGSQSDAASGSAGSEAGSEASNSQSESGSQASGTQSTSQTASNQTSSGNGQAGQGDSSTASSADNPSGSAGQESRPGSQTGNSQSAGDGSGSTPEGDAGTANPDRSQGGQEGSRSPDNGMSDSEVIQRIKQRMDGEQAGAGQNNPQTGDSGTGTGQERAAGGNQPQNADQPQDNPGKRDPSATGQSADQSTPAGTNNDQAAGARDPSANANPADAQSGEQASPQSKAAQADPQPPNTSQDNPQNGSQNNQANSPQANDANPSSSSQAGDSNQSAPSSQSQQEQPSGQTGNSGSQAGQSGDSNSSAEPGQSESNQSNGQSSQSGAQGNQPGSQGDSSSNSPSGQSGSDSGQSGSQGGQSDSQSGQPGSQSGQSGSESGASGSQGGQSGNEGDPSGSQGSQQGAGNSQTGEAGGEQTGSDSGSESAASGGEQQPPSQSGSGGGSGGESNKPNAEGAGSQANQPTDAGGASSSGGESSSAAGGDSSGSSQSSGDGQSASSSAGKPNTGGVGNGSGAASGSGTGTGEAEAANEQYAEETAQMVLDYLDRQKEQPSPELLNDLDWSKQDLNRFVERWKAARDLAARGDESAKQDWERLLEDLNLRGAGGQARAAAQRNDSFQQMLDSGGRVRPPENLRRQYEQFRQALERARR